MNSSYLPSWPQLCKIMLFAERILTILSENFLIDTKVLFFFSMLRLIYLFTSNSHLGPLQISLGRMVEDIMKWLCIMVLVIMSFAAGMNQLYWVYKTDGIREPAYNEDGYPEEGPDYTNDRPPDICFGVRCKDQNNAFTE